MKKLFLVFFIVILSVGCDVQKIIASNIMDIINSGTILGYEWSDCMSIEVSCVEGDGEFYIGLPGDVPLCSCSWDDNNN